MTPQPAQPEGTTLPQALSTAYLPFTLSAALTALAWAAAGPSLGLWFAGLATLTLILPTTIAAQSTWPHRLFAAAAVIDGVGLVWLLSIFFSGVCFTQWLAAYALLAACALPLAALSLLLLRIPAIATLIALAWLTWPIWSSPLLTADYRQQLVEWLIWPHPLFALNGLLTNVYPVPWPQHRLAYILTNLGDDIPYTMPPTIWPSLLLHLLLGLILLAPTLRRCSKDINHGLH